MSQLPRPNHKPDRFPNKPLGRFAASLLGVMCGTAFSDATELVAIPGPGGETDATVVAMSRDGNTLVGVAGTNFFRWTPDGGSEAIPDPGFKTVLDVSGDGNTILGKSTDGDGLWVAGQGFTPLEIPTPEGYEGLIIREMSDDAQTIAGTIRISLQLNGTRALSGRNRRGSPFPIQSRVRVGERCTYPGTARS